MPPGDATVSDAGMPMSDAAEPVALEAYARAAAVLAGLDIDDAWWPGVLGHLDVLIQRAASLDDDGVHLPDDPAPVFQP